jgi:hypothetical protein
MSEMSDKSIESNASNLITLAEKKIYFPQRVTGRLLDSLNQFAFITKTQWTLLMVLNIICLMFIVLVSTWVV